MQSWKEVNVWSSTVYSCDFHEGRQHFITLLMFVLNFVLFFNLFTVHNHIIDACVEFCFLKKQFLNLAINMQLLLPRTRSASGVKWSTVVSIYIYICLWSKKKFESYFRDRLTFSNVDSRTSRRIYRLALLLRAPETLSSLSKSRISIFNAHLTLLVRKMTSHNSIGKYRHLVNWLGTCLGTERRCLQTRLVECRTGKKWMLELHCLLLWIFMKVDNITLMMFVLNFVEFCFILELIYSSDFLNFAF